MQGLTEPSKADKAGLGGDSTRDPADEAKAPKDLHSAFILRSDSFKLSLPAQLDQLSALHSPPPMLSCDYNDGDGNLNVTKLHERVDYSHSRF